MSDPLDTDRPRGRPQRTSARDPWFNLTFSGILRTHNQWVDLRRQKDGNITGRPLPQNTGICHFCHGWRPTDSKVVCADPPPYSEEETSNFSSDSYTDWFERPCYKVRDVNIATYAPGGSRPLNLYWVETSDHDEDWFIIAKNSRSACSYHEQYEGYNSGDANASLVAPIPDQWLCHNVGHPHCINALFTACGGARVHYTPDQDPQAVALRRRMGVIEEAWQFNGTVYTPGDIVANVMALESRNSQKSRSNRKPQQ